jgi:hypothetical protein
MMLTAAEEVLEPDSKLFARIKWIKQKADALGIVRNDAVHLVVAPEIDLTEPRTRTRLVPNDIVMPRKRIDRLKTAQTIEKRFKYLSGDLFALQTYALAVLYQMADPERTLPKRPKLRCAPNQK